MAAAVGPAISVAALSAAACALRTVSRSAATSRDHMAARSSCHVSCICCSPARTVLTQRCVITAFLRLVSA